VVRCSTLNNSYFNMVDDDLVTLFVSIVRAHPIVVPLCILVCIIATLSFLSRVGCLNPMIRRIVAFFGVTLPATLKHVYKALAGVLGVVVGSVIRPLWHATYSSWLWFLETIIAPTYAHASVLAGHIGMAMLVVARAVLSAMLFVKHAICVVLLWIATVLMVLVGWLSICLSFIKRTVSRIVWFGYTNVVLPVRNDIAAIMTLLINVFLWCYTSIVTPGAHWGSWIAQSAIVYTRIALLFYVVDPFVYGTTLLRRGSEWLLNKAVITFIWLYRHVIVPGAHWSARAAQTSFVYAKFAVLVYIVDPIVCGFILLRRASEYLGAISLKAAKWFYQNVVVTCAMVIFATLVILYEAIAFFEDLFFGTILWIAHYVYMYVVVTCARFAFVILETLYLLVKASEEIAFETIEWICGAILFTIVGFVLVVALRARRTIAWVYRCVIVPIAVAIRSHIFHPLLRNVVLPFLRWIRIAIKKHGCAVFGVALVALPTYFGLASHNFALLLVFPIVLCVGVDLVLWNYGHSPVLVPRALLLMFVAFRFVLLAGIVLWILFDCVSEPHASWAWWIASAPLSGVAVFVLHQLLYAFKGPQKWRLLADGSLARIAVQTFRFAFALPIGPMAAAVATLSLVPLVFTSFNIAIFAHGKRLSVRGVGRIAIFVQLLLAASLTLFHAPRTPLALIVSALASYSYLVIGFCLIW
jgi:hypothetical protein